MLLLSSLLFDKQTFIVLGEFALVFAIPVLDLISTIENFLDVP
jgi:hypothetical protein